MGKIIRIREVGDPILSKKCEKINLNNITTELLDIIEDMKETLAFTEGFGIAAPQIGINKQIAIIKIDKDKCTYKNCENVPTTVMINPTWKKLSDIQNIEYEGCLSVPCIRGKIKRYEHIEVTYHDESGKKIIKTVHGFTARDIQHECDHLDGIVFLEKVESPNGYTTKDMMFKFNLRENL